MALKLEDVKRQLGIPQADNSQDPELNQLIAEAIRLIEEDTHIVGADSQWEWYPLALLERTAMPIRNPRTIDSIEYVDTAGQIQTVPTSDYELDLSKVQPELVLTDFSKPWPATSVNSPRPWTVKYTAGVLQIDDVDPIYTQAGKALVAQLYDPDSDQKPLGDVYEALVARQFASYP